MRKTKLNFYVKHIALDVSNTGFPKIAQIDVVNSSTIR